MNGNQRNAALERWDRPGEEDGLPEWGIVGPDNRGCFRVRAWFGRRHGWRTAGRNLDRAEAAAIAIALNELYSRTP